MADLGLQNDANVVRRRDLAAVSDLAGNGFAVLTPSGAENDAALEGDYRLVRLRPGLTLHSSSARELEDLTTRIEHKPGITCSLFLEGQVAATIGGRSFVLGTRPGGRGRPQPQGLLISYAQPDILVRRSVRGNFIRKVHVSIQPEWLDAAGLELPGDPASISRFRRTHLDSFRWTPSPRLVSLAEQVLSPCAFGPLLRNLYLESRAIEIIAEAFQVLSEVSERDQAAALRPREWQRVYAARDFIEANAGKPVTLEAIGQQVGISVNTLQRLFHSAYGMSVFEFIRTQNLRRARDALLREGVTVAQAAYLAGYTSPANFATAFKRRFGVSPKTARAGL